MIMNQPFIQTDVYALSTRHNHTELKNNFITLATIIIVQNFEKNLSISFSVSYMSNSVDESIHDRVYPIKLELDNHVPNLPA